MIIGKYNNIIDFNGHLKFTGVEKDPYIVVDVIGNLPTDYTDITSIDSFDTHWKELLGVTIGFKDEKSVQREIDLLANAKCSNDVNTNWSNLTASEQIAYCKWVTSKVSPTNFGATITDPLVRESMSYDYDKRNTMSRGTWRIDGNGFGRLEVLRIYLFSKIGASNALALMKDAVTDGLIKSYEDGIESFANDGIVGLKDFFLSTTGTPYDGSGTINGLSLRTYPIIDGSNDTISAVSNTCSLIMDGYY